MGLTVIERSAKSRTLVLGLAFICGLFLTLDYAKADGVSTVAAHPHSTRLGLPQFSMHYHVLRNGWHLGNAVFSLQRRGHIYKFVSMAEPTGIASLFIHTHLREETRFTLKNGQLVPLDYRYTDSGHPDHDQLISFDWKRNFALSHFDHHTKKIALKVGTLDRLLAQLAISRDMQQQGHPREQYFVAYKGKIKIYRLKHKGSSDVKAAGKNWRTQVIVRNDRDSKRKMTFWLAPRLHNLPIKMQQQAPGKATITFVLTSVNLEGH